ncbi:MAG: hypothetical protein ACM34I_08110 [bacterium]
MTLAAPFRHFTGGTGNISGVAFRITKGLKSNFVDGWGPESLTTCTDCHNTSNTGVTKARGPHGSANRWLLANAESTTVTDINGGVTTLNATPLNPMNFCLNCHSNNVYPDVAPGTNTVASPTNMNYARFSHPDGGNGGDWDLSSGSNNGTYYGIICMTCHGGTTNGPAGTPGPGQLHGSNLGPGTYGTSPRGFRFMNGSDWDGHDTALDNTSACYTLSSGPTSLASCTHHNGGGAGNYTPNYQY